MFGHTFENLVVAEIAAAVAEHLVRQVVDIVLLIFVFFKYRNNYHKK